MTTPNSSTENGVAGRTERAVIARAQGATKTYGSGDTAVVALSGVDIDIEAGTFVAIMGPSGSGKSTLMHCLAGLDTLSFGNVYIGDQELGALPERKLTALRRDRIGFVFQAFNLVPTLTAAENITLPVALRGGAVDETWFDLVIDAVGIKERLAHRPSELSGGQQQRVAVARALVARPDVVFADEPTGNLDSQSGVDVLTLLRRAVDEFGQTTVMVTHDANAAAWADRVVFLADGSIVSELHEPTVELILEKMTRLGNR